MALEKFDIILDNVPEAGYYTSGEIVAGRAVINANGEIKTTGLQLVFSGKATTSWSEGSGQYRRYYNDAEVFFNLTDFAVGDGQTPLKIPSGETTYRFSFHLPHAQLPCNFNSDDGEIEYSVEGVVKRALFERNFRAKTIFQVNCPLNLNNEPEAGQRGEWSNSKTFCCFCCASRPLSMYARMKKKGYCPGDTIVVEGEVNNQSTRTVTHVSAELQECVTFKADNHSKTTGKSLITDKYEQPIVGGQMDMTYRIELPIPQDPVPNLAGCNIINVEYIVEVQAHISGLALNLRVPCTILIGTVPLIRTLDAYSQEL